MVAASGNREGGDGPKYSDGCHSARLLESCELFAGETEIQIRHGDDLYRLRQTRNGRLILTK